MSSRQRIVAAVGGVVAVIAAGLAWRARAGTTASEDAVAGLHRDRVRLEARVRGEEEKLKAAEVEHAALLAERDRRQSIPPPKASAAPARPTLPPMNSPEQQAARLRRYRVGLRTDYFSFVRAAGLSEGQVAQFEEILTTHKGNEMDLSVTAAERKIPMSDRAIAALRSEEKARYETELAKLLGEEGRGKLEKFEAMAPERRAVAEMAGTLALTAEPLTAAQTQQLTAVLLDLRPREGRLDAKDMWAAAVRRGEGFLTPGQLGELEMRASIIRRESGANEFFRLVEQLKK